MEFCLFCENFYEGRKNFSHSLPNFTFKFYIWFSSCQWQFFQSTTLHSHFYDLSHFFFFFSKTLHLMIFTIIIKIDVNGWEWREIKVDRTVIKVSIKFFFLSSPRSILQHSTQHVLTISRLSKNWKKVYFSPHRPESAAPLQSTCTTTKC